MSNFYSPLRYPGGKNCVFNFIGALFYENQLIGCSYAEPYAGGAGLALRLLFEGYVEKIYINDYDYSIYTFWKYAINNTDDLCEWIDTVEITIDNWNKYKKIQQKIEIYSEEEVARCTFFLNRTNISGVIKGGVIGGQKQTGKYKIDARFNRKTLINRLQKLKNVKNRIIVSNLDGIDFINQLDRNKENIFIYLDPPYVKKGAELYMNFYNECDHKNLSNNVYGLKKKWLVSYDNHELILQLYSKSSKVLHRLSQATSNKIGDEVFVFSNNLVFKNSIKKLKSPQLLAVNS